LDFIFQKLQIKDMLKKDSMNPLYFACFLGCLLTMHLSHFFLWGTLWAPIPLFFFLQTLGQAVLEVSALYLLAYLLKQYAPRSVFYAFIGLSFSLLLLHFVDFNLVRLMDASLSYPMKYLFFSGVDHFITAIHSLNLNGWAALLFVALLILVPWTGIFLYRITEPLARKMGGQNSLRLPLILLTSAAIVVLGLDFAFQPWISRQEYRHFQKALPLGATLFAPSPACISLPSFRKARKEAQVQQALSTLKFSKRTLPNLYLFVIETLRKDFITEEIAPHLTAFREQNISFAKSFANANGTHASWFAIFHADHPYVWTSMAQDWQEGSLPLQMLRKMGYQCRVYAAADLKLFHMDQLLFGKDRKLLEYAEEYAEDRSLEPCDRDEMAIRAALRDLGQQENQQGKVYLFFLDSTHSEYSFPKEFPLKFEPIVSQIDYLTLAPHNIEPLKNRYRNAVAYVDSLMGHFFEGLQEMDLYEEALIAITGDHGEEFFEEGALFHGTHLNEYQTSVPIYFKLQNNPWTPHRQETTHIDLFPTLLHHLTGRSDHQIFWDGESIFIPATHSYRIAVQHNGAQAPTECVLEEEEMQLHLRTLNEEPLEGASFLEVISKKKRTL
jgi:membrane-anchored protein YejM (alkaline phosphatase superfamily)